MNQTSKEGGKKRELLHQSNHTNEDTEKESEPQRHYKSHP